MANKCLSCETCESHEKSFQPNWLDFKIAIPIAVSFLIVFVFMQKLGLVNLISEGKIGMGTMFIVGMVASLSACMAVVGGLVLSVSATFAKGGNTVKPQVMFYVGRLISFFIFGGIIGSLGSVFTLNNYLYFGLSLLIGFVMLLMGINLLDIFPWARKLQPIMPKIIAENVFVASKFNSVFTPILVGVATFFLPCGFTQSMQLYALTTGNFIDGAITMLVFALGTLPVLALISFSSIGFKDSSKAGIFFKASRLIVITFALFNIINSLVVIGVISPVFNF